MFATGFQSLAFQTPGNDNQPTGGGKDYVYVTPYQRYLADQYQEKIRKEKTELQKVDSVLEDYNRKLELARLAKSEAKRKAMTRLAAQEREYLEEINRLMQVRALLLLRIRQNEEALIVLMMCARRRKRA